MTDDGMDQMDPPSPKVVAALLREARSVSRRADKLGADVAAMQDPTIQELAAQASSSIDQLVHQLIDAVAGLRGELLDGRILHRGDIGAEFGRAPRYRPGLAEQGRDHLRRRRIHLVPAVLGHDHDCAARRKPRLRGSGA